jgi:hypothetical protein
VSLVRSYRHQKQPVPEVMMQFKREQKLQDDFDLDQANKERDLTVFISKY